MGIVVYLLILKISVIFYKPLLLTSNLLANNELWLKPSKDYSGRFLRHICQDQLTPL